VKKLLLGILLLAIIVAISYIKTVREEERIDSVLEQARQESSFETGKIKTAYDSLSALYAETEESLTDSISSLYTAIDSKTDSLNELASAKDSLSKALAAKPKATTIKKSNNDSQLAQHRKIIDYYKQRHASLPKDLSAYEMRVAKNEIRQETAQKFSISLAELDKIRNEFKLSY
jgi:hypothetical protein